MNTVGLLAKVRKAGAASVRLPLQVVRRLQLERSLQKRVASAKQLISVTDLRTKTLDYLDSMKITEGTVGRYRYASSQHEPVLYASVYAALTRHLYDDLNKLTDEERAEWADYICSFQCDDGLFRDSAVANEIAEIEDWWGWRHMTLHVTMALSVLGATVRFPFGFLEPFQDPGFLTSWLKSRDWDQRPDFVSNEVQNIGALLQYSRDFHHNELAGPAVDCLLEWLDSTQNPETGLWVGSCDTPELLSRGVQTGYHLWLLFFYDDRRVRHVQRIIDNLLATQNKLGGFGVVPNSSACEDIDSIDPLARLSLMADYRRQEIQAALQKSFRWVLANVNEDGGFVFRRDQSFVYGHENMSSGVNESAMFPTWFRALSLAYISQALDLPGWPADAWHWVRCPGYQFWK